MSRGVGPEVCLPCKTFHATDWLSFLKIAFSPLLSLVQPIHCMYTLFFLGGGNVVDRRFAVGS